MAPQISKQSEKRSSLIPQLLLILVLAVYLVLIPFGFINSANRLGVPELVLVTLLLLWVSGMATRLVDLSVSSTGVSAKFREIETRQETIEFKVHTLQVIIKSLVTEFEYQKLEGLARSGPFLVRFHESMIKELERLDALRYIQPKPGYGIVNIRERDGRGDEFDLKQYVYITNEGLEYLKLRDQFPSSAS